MAFSLVLLYLKLRDPIVHQAVTGVEYALALFGNVWYMAIIFPGLPAILEFEDETISKYKFMNLYILMLFLAVAIFGSNALNFLCCRKSLSVPNSSFWMSPSLKKDTIRLMFSFVLSQGSMTLVYLLCNFCVIFQYGLTTSTRHQPEGLLATWLLVSSCVWFLFIFFHLWCVRRFFRQSLTGLPSVATEEKDLPPHMRGQPATGDDTFCAVLTFQADDQRLCIPKRFGFGRSFNFAHYTAPFVLNLVFFILFFPLLGIIILEE
mmetsp:Transcript_31054/g.41040  ORF Transcript_31054/g.41040 Transcript_31054/m.41040 type:complete len:263 (+) Transcript_31054:73-861(+)